MSCELFCVDAFTDRVGSGNPAGVCILSSPRKPAWMQLVAREMNHSETAFLVPQPQGFDLRWFTPRIEVDLCGHATLASAHILRECGLFGQDGIARFFTRSGVLTASCAGDGINLDFPAEPEVTTTAPPGLIDALGARPVYVGRNRFDYLVEVASVDEVQRLKP